MSEKYYLAPVPIPPWFKVQWRCGRSRRPALAVTSCRLHKLQGRPGGKKMPDYHFGVRRKAINAIMVFLFART